MNLRRFLLLPLWVLVLGACGAYGQTIAPVACPWLTAGTAALVLAGEVTVHASVSDAGEGTCSFVRVSDPEASLNIEVRRSVLNKCGTASIKLKGIGNEAVRCSLPEVGGRSLEAIDARVRDRYFTIAMRGSAVAARSKSEDPQDDLLEHAAESVAGNLF